MVKMMTNLSAVEPSSHLVHCFLFAILVYVACYTCICSLLPWSRTVAPIHSDIVSRDKNMLMEHARSLEFFGLWFWIWLRVGTTLWLVRRKGK